MAGLDVSALQAIDTHVHVEADRHGCFALDDELLAASAKYFKADADRAPTLDQIAGVLPCRGSMAAVVFTVDAHTATGHPALSSAEIVERGRPARRRAHPVRVGRPARRRHAAGSRGSWLSRRCPRAEAAPLAAGLRAERPSAATRCTRLGRQLALPVVFHTGQTGIGAGLPGGRGHQAAVLRPDAARRRRRRSSPA